jgi:disulfide oxidoreductase YuzD
MKIRQGQEVKAASPQPEWLMLLFTLPASQASKRVEVWRKLKKYGALNFRSSGYLLPRTPVNQERFEWLSAAIRKYKGQASVLELHSIHDTPSEELRRVFIQERASDYELVLKQVRNSKRDSGTVARLRRRLQEIAEVDFFGSPLRSRVETAIAALESPQKQPKKTTTKHKRLEYTERMWVTRPRPGIDRVGSAWLIKNHIDPDAKFLFSNDAKSVPGAIPFDMFNVGGFTHQGENCTFETLCEEFAIRDQAIRSIAEIVHDADLNDDKFGRSEGAGLDRVLTGWAQLGISDEELLRRGTELIEGLYTAIKQQPK